jgi:hypothetical protein
MGLLKIVLSIVSYNIIFYYDSHEIIPILVLIFLYYIYFGNTIDLKITIISPKNFHVYTLHVVSGCKLKYLGLD